MRVHDLLCLTGDAFEAAATAAAAAAAAALMGGDNPWGAMAAHEAGACRGVCVCVCVCMYLCVCVFVCASEYWGKILKASLEMQTGCT
jgi:hypothetical protein